MAFQEHYGNSTLDLIHNYFPALLYENTAFSNVQQVFAYVNIQMDRHYNLFSSARSSYMARYANYIPQPPQAQPQPNINVPNPANHLAEILHQMLHGNDNVINMAGWFNAPIQHAMDPVIVHPTPEQIQGGTIVERNEQDGEICSICQDTIPFDSDMRTIRHCEHSFHVGCIDTWFQRNVRCPVCRHDIRDAPPDTD
jgi:hypothetical protein